MTTTDRSALRADCGNCFALCCTAFGFQRSADFPIDKPAGTPCGNLADDFSCTIHQTLRPRGFRGCTVFDCSGAGQYVSQTLYDGVSWRDHPDSRAEMFRVFPIVRLLHEMLWHLAEAQDRAVTPDSAEDAGLLTREIRRVLVAGRPTLLALDVEPLHERVRDVLVEVSGEVRARYRAGQDDSRAGLLRPGADLAGRDLRGRPMAGADLRGATAIGADLRGVDLSGVDLLGVDLRDARLDGADLSTALFLTQAQVNAAGGDTATMLPDGIDRPSHWVSEVVERTVHRIPRN
ncbi:MULTISPECIES: pentapeptide repeat-containing protein [Curtobacterium]|uniref:Pentapeptide repeat-containing protein n=1 Tax=Curtobacterium poinsettiae TaxID=159612 RepID=A0ABT3RZ61_9MICO|nr:MULTISPECIES: pentapeptide repeat-containing protein [Curtobacterium]MBT1596163.1 pentapeptide repeat-containing protein [Curtobacterium flaccumfaciens pv. flaccumfaciens]MBT1609856.1 pentapeptide repeat-containing protein [Curtobacterium flaccumfaciens pv. poinsettiae]MCS6575236.1 pentapeptide repeat-containing protein [Curtobacterium flaccumfaciens pv. flaccumfaciens]MCX2847533.1 pentapeptide repeat-containing protein [Curtobacterium flaccumfaciens pv. poinsettiae]UXN17375.1 pentapeptide 